VAHVVQKRSTGAQWQTSTVASLPPASLLATGPSVSVMADMLESTRTAPVCCLPTAPALVSSSNAQKVTKNVLISMSVCLWAYFRSYDTSRCCL